MASVNIQFTNNQSPVDTTQAGVQNVLRSHMPPLTSGQRGAKSRRLADIQRGVQTYRSLEKIAEEHWHSVLYAEPESRTLPKRSRLDPIHNSSGLRPGLRERVSNSNRNNRLISSYTNTHYMPSSSSKHNVLSDVTEGHPGEVTRGPGSRLTVLPVDYRLTHSTAPVRLPAREYIAGYWVPPKKHLPRVVEATRRAVNTLTQFQSHNGSIDVIGPFHGAPKLDPLHTKKEHTIYGSLNRESTFLMMKRIEDILEPKDYVTGSTMGTSILEVSLVEGMDITDLESCLKGVDSPVSVEDMEPREHTIDHDVEYIHPSQPKRRVDVFTKCRAWLEMWF